MDLQGSVCVGDFGMVTLGLLPSHLSGRKLRAPLVGAWRGGQFADLVNDLAHDARLVDGLVTAAFLDALKGAVADDVDERGVDEVAALPGHFVDPVCLGVPEPQAGDVSRVEVERQRVVLRSEGPHPNRPEVLEDGRVIREVLVLDAGVTRR